MVDMCRQCACLFAVARRRDVSEDTSTDTEDDMTW